MNRFFNRLSTKVKTGWHKIVREEIDDALIQYSQLQHQNENTAKVYHQYDLPSIFPFMTTIVQKDETPETLAKIFNISTNELLLVNGVSINSVQTRETQSEKICKKFAEGKKILIPKISTYCVLDKSRLLDLLVYDIKEFRIEKVLLRIDQPTYFCYYCTIGGDILGKLSFCDDC